VVDITDMMDATRRRRSIAPPRAHRFPDRVSTMPAIFPDHRKQPEKKTLAPERHLFSLIAHLVWGDTLARLLRGVTRRTAGSYAERAAQGCAREPPDANVHFICEQISLKTLRAKGSILTKVSFFFWRIYWCFQGRVAAIKGA
jgi:hypothetical protein